ncbi:MAG: trigger factor [Paludibacteraceae bacterium]|nr:trigger factor [Paludibacteraceae bacterium]
MQINHTEFKDLTSVVTLTLTPADYEEAVTKQLRQLRQKADIPGFRKGMVPIGLIKKMYGKSVLADVLNNQIAEQLTKYIEEQKLHILGDPMPNDELTPNMDLDNDTEFTFAFDIAVPAEFDAKLTGKNKLTQYTITVDKKMVDNQVNSYAERFGEYVDVEDFKDGDVLRGTLTEQKEGGIVKENAILNPQYMADKKQAKLFNGAKKNDVITFNPMKAFQNETEVASLLDLKKDDVKELNSDFTLTITSITRHQAAKIDGELFAKVYGENNVKDEAEFRTKVQAEIEANMAEDAKYKFGLDAKAAILKKAGEFALPEAFLKRWVAATNKDMKPEDLDRDFPEMLKQLRWQLAKDQLMKEYDVKVEKDDINAYAREVARMQFLQYGMMHVEEQYLNSFAENILKDENQLRGIVERVAENKIYDHLRTVAKIEEKAISYEDFGKLMRDNA